MKRLTIWIAMVFALLLASCGGGGEGSLSLAGGGSGTGGGGSGGGVGSGGTGIFRISAIGPITGFGSIFVNGIEFDVDTASLALEDAPGGLALGMVVQVEGTASGSGATRATATAVVSSVDLRGPVSSVDAAGGTLVVFGTTVSTDASTVFDGVTSLAGLSAGDTVQAYGLPAGTAGMYATRIEKLSAGASPVQSGTVTNLDTATMTFTLGNLTVHYASASFIGGLEAAQLANGLSVKVRGTSAPAGGVLQATRIQPWYRLPTADGEAANVTSVVSDFASLGSFRLLGTTVDASTAQITGGPASAIGNGVTVEVSGTLQQGVLIARTVKIRHVPGTGGPSSFTLSGTVGAYVSPASFRVQGQPVDASDPGVDFSGGTSANLRNGAKVDIVGSRVVDGVLIADTVSFRP